MTWEPVKVYQVMMDGFQKRHYICATSLAFYEPIRNSDKTFTGGVLFKERQRFDCCLGPVNLSSVAVMKPFTFSKRWKMGGGMPWSMRSATMPNATLLQVKSFCVLMAFGWIGNYRKIHCNRPLHRTLKLPWDVENPRISYGKTWWSSRGIHDATAAPQIQLLLPSSSVAGEWFWRVFGMRETMSFMTLITVIITITGLQQYIL